ncbi:MAG: glycosyl hydrolase, partial [Gammaproteobacteria bacterium]
LKLPSILNRESTVRDWTSDPRAWKAVRPVFEKLNAQMAAMFGLEGESADHGGVDMSGFMQEMPLLSLLQFQERFFDRPVEDIVDEILEEVHGQKA